MIRRLTPADWLAFRDIRLEMLRDEPGAFASPYEDWVAKPEAMIREWMTRIQTYGVVEGTEVVACAALSRSTQKATAHRAELVAVYTRPKYRGKGLMRGLLDRIASDARKANILQLELQVAAWNADAIASYDRIGFRRTGLLPRAVRHADGYTDDVIMVWPLDTDAGPGAADA